MNEQEKQLLIQRYNEEKERGVKFFPDTLYKDVLVGFMLFILLVGLAAFVGVPTDAPADPTDTAYIPRPDWYFLFLFEMLKAFPGKIEFVGTVVVPGVAILLLLVLPFFDQSTRRHPLSRPVATGVMSAVVVAIIGLTIAAQVTTPPEPASEAAGASYAQQLTTGQQLFVLNCAKCHGPDGEGGVIKGVQGLEGFNMLPIHSRDFLYTRTDDTIFNIINMGQPSLGMPPFGQANGGPFSMQQINAVVTFVRSWDDRVVTTVTPQGAGIPTLAPGEIPDYETNVQPILNRYCIGCHNGTSAPNKYVLTDYKSVMTSGAHAPNVVAGDLNSHLFLQISGKTSPAGGPMPPTGSLDPKYVDIIRRWIEAGTLPQRPSGTAPAGTPSAPGPASPLETPGSISPLATPGMASPLETPGTPPVAGSVVAATEAVSGSVTAPNTAQPAAQPGTPTP